MARATMSKRRLTAAWSRDVVPTVSGSPAMRIASVPSVAASASSRCRSSASTRLRADSSDGPKRARSRPQPVRPTTSAAAAPTRTMRKMRDTVNHRIHGCYSEIDLDLRHLLKRGALLAAANWPAVAIQFIAETTFQVLLAVPIIGAAILVAVLLGADLADLLQGSLREMFTTIASALLSEPVALVAFIAAFAVVLLGGSVLMFVVKGGIVEVLAAANLEAGPIERQPLSVDLLKQGSRFTLERFTEGCARLFRPYLALGLVLMAVYAASIGSYLAFVAYAYRAAEGRALIICWTVIATL